MTDIPTVLLFHLQIVVMVEYENVELCCHISPFLVTAATCLVLIQLLVVFFFSALFIALVGFAALATVCDPTWRSVYQTLSRCLIGCCRRPVELCLLRFEENCVNNLSYSSVKINIYSAIAPPNVAHQYIFK